MATNHDARYRKLFSHPEMVQELLTGFVHEEFVRDLDFSRMQRINAGFVDRRFHRHEADLVWRIPLAAEKGFIFILLEFQSTGADKNCDIHVASAPSPSLAMVDRFMALRMQRYAAELLDSLRRSPGSQPRFLPPVFPLLVYNGERPWTAPDDLRTLLQPDLGRIWNQGFRYCPIVEKEFPDDRLLSIGNAVSAVFYIENSRPAELPTRLARVAPLLRKFAPSITHLLAGWFRDYLKDCPDYELNCAILDKTITLEEEPSMLETALKGYIAIERKKAITEGRSEGLAMGKAEGKAETLVRLLERRFGPGAAGRERVLACTDTARLDMALDAILDAPDAGTVLRLLDGE